jgi:tetratricopeptide (TPR) repeat protein
MSNSPKLKKGAAPGSGRNKLGPIPKDIEIAAQKIDAGELRPAELILQQILNQEPENAHALHLMGIIAYRVGRGELALDLTGRAIARLPNEAQFHVNRGEMCRSLKRLDEAVSHGEKAVRLNPASATAHANLGIAYYDLKAYDRAETCQKKALELQPALVTALNNLGSIQRARKDGAGAIAYYRQALAINPDYLESMNNLGALLIEEDQVEEAIKILLTALKVNPRYADAHNNLGNAFLSREILDKATAAYSNALKLRPAFPEAMLGLARIDKEQDKLDDALLQTRRALELDPDKAEGYSLLGDIHLKQGAYQESEEAFAQAMALDSEQMGTYLGLGQLRMEQGRLEEAKAAYAQAAKLRPDDIAPHVLMAQVRKSTANDPMLARLEQESAKLPTMTPNRALSLHFALGKIYDDLGNYDRAFSHFQEGCRIKRGTLDYNSEHHSQVYRNIASFFTAETLARLDGAGDPSDLPIFVLGMPRSGTTLVETILASHPQVFAAGELNDLLRIANQPKPGVLSEGFPLSMQGLTAEDLKKMGSRYVAGLRKHSTVAGRITDKMPANFMALGLIHLMLPNAKVLHVQRNPADICLSGFTRHFNSNSQLHSYDLREMGLFYVDYARLMEHWRQVLPEGAFLDVRYEELVAEPEENTRAILEYCGLDWDDACLTPHKTKRTVKTASVTQVREPVYTTSVERWRRYEQHLGPLFEALGEYAPH